METLRIVKMYLNPSVFSRVFINLNRHCSESLKSGISDYSYLDSINRETINVESMYLTIILLSRDRPTTFRQRLYTTYIVPTNVYVKSFHGSYISSVVRSKIIFSK